VVLASIFSSPSLVQAEQMQDLLAQLGEIFFIVRGHMTLLLLSRAWSFGR
jgi:hypothetical protein